MEAPIVTKHSGSLKDKETEPLKVAASTPQQPSPFYSWSKLHLQSDSWWQLISLPPSFNDHFRFPLSSDSTLILKGSSLLRPWSLHFVHLSSKLSKRIPKWFPWVVNIDLPAPIVWVQSYFFLVRVKSCVEMVVPWLMKSEVPSQ